MAGKLQNACNPDVSHSTTPSTTLRATANSGQAFALDMTRGISDLSFEIQDREFSVVLFSGLVVCLRGFCANMSG